MPEQREGDQQDAASGRHVLAALRWKAGIAAGVGLGAMLDGIIFHELLGWHHFLSDVGGHHRDTVGDLRENLVADGLFHLAAVTVTVAAFVLLWRDGRAGRLPDARTAIGSIIMAWAAFDLFDGVVLHLLLSLHHVHEDHELLSDLAYLAVNVGLLAVGAFVARRPLGGRHTSS